MGQNTQSNGSSSSSSSSSCLPKFQIVDIAIDIVRPPIVTREPATLPIPLAAYSSISRAPLGRVKGYFLDRLGGR